MEKFIEKEYGSVFEKFFEIFGIMKSNENMSIHKNFNSYFDGSLGNSLFRLVIQYMKDIVIASNEKVDFKRAIVKNIEAARFARETKSLDEENKRFVKTNFFIDITGDILPGNIGDNLIFTEKQRKDMGMMSREEKREIKKYRFFQAVFSNVNAVIFTKKNEDKGIDVSPFLDELCIKYDLEIKKALVDLNGSIEALKNVVFEKEKGYPKFEIEEFPKDNEDFKDRKLSMGAYDYSNLKQCRLKFYFQKMNNLEYLCPSEESDISSRFFGILVHKVLEEIVKGMWKEVISKGNFNIDNNYIKEILSKHFSYNRAKIPLHMDNYCSEIMIPIIASNIEKFFNYIEAKYSNIEIKRFQGEKGVYETKPFIDANGCKVEIINKKVSVYDAEGKLLRVENIIDYTKTNIKGEFASLDNFINTWTCNKKKEEISNLLLQQGIDLNALKDILAKCGNTDEISDAQIQDIKAAKEKLMQSAQKLFAKMYEQAQAQGGAQAGPDMGAGAQGGSNEAYGDDVVDGDYREV